MAETFAGEQNAARRTLLKGLRDTDRKIAEIYTKASEDLTALASAQKPGGLTGRWQQDMAASLSERVRQLNGQVLSTVSGSVEQAARLPGEAGANWLTRVLERATGSQSGGDAFRSVMTRTSDEALRAVVNGQAYLDGKSLSQRIWTHGGRLQGGIDEILRQGIAQKKSAYQLAKELEAFVNPKAREAMDWRTVYPDLPTWLSERWTSVEKNSQRLARTSINHAYHVAMKEAALANPFAESIHWALSPQHYQRQILPFGADVCDEYSAHNEGLGVGNWPVNDVPLPHANCLCSQYAVVGKSLDRCANELKEWLDGGENAELDRAFGQWKQETTGNAVDRGARFDAAQERNALIEQAAALRGVDTMDVEARERLFIDLENLSLEELRRIASGS